MEEVNEWGRPIENVLSPDGCGRRRKRRRARDGWLYFNREVEYQPCLVMMTWYLDAPSLFAAPSRLMTRRLFSISRA